MALGILVLITATNESTLINDPQVIVDTKILTIEIILENKYKLL